MGPDVAGILRMLEWSHATGTLAIAAGEIDLADGKPVAAWATGGTAGRAAVANALMTSDAGAAYGGPLWNDDMSTRFGATGTRLLTPLRVDAGRIDAASLRDRKDLDELVPFLRGLLRAIHAEAAKSVGEGAA